jgi:hypothetical protein
MLRGLPCVPVSLRAVSVGLLGLMLALAACGSTTSGNRSSKPSSGAQPRVSAPPGSSTTSASRSERGAAAQATRRSLQATKQAPPTAGGRPSGGLCRSGDPLANVYHAYRLHVVRNCITVTGTVAYRSREDDGDIHVNLSLPSGEANLLNQANIADEHDNLVTEIVPADQPGCTPGQPPTLPPTAYTSSSYSYGICTGADIATPPLDAQVAVTGPYVLDTDHGWMEIHPVWSITVTGQGPLSPPETGPSPSVATVPSAGAWCQASASPANDGYAGDYEVYVHSNQPDTRATASDAGDTWSDNTDSSGYAVIRLYNASPGTTITVTVGAASCSATAKTASHLGRPADYAQSSERMLSAAPEPSIVSLATAR